MIEINELREKWSETAMIIRRPKLAEAAEVIGGLLSEVERLQREVDYQRNRQNAKEQQLAVMFVELDSVVRKYGNEICKKT